MSQANVEIFQCFPEGVPREVMITGSAEEVELAEAMVNEVSYLPGYCEATSGVPACSNRWVS